MAVSKAQQKAVNGYIARNYDRINLTVPKGRKADIDAYAKSKGTSTVGLLNDLLMREISMTEAEWKAKPTGAETTE